MDKIKQLDNDEIIRQKYLARGPGDAATKAYIAAKYLDDSSRKKKKKKKSSATTPKLGNIGIIDEDAFGWNTEDKKKDTDTNELEIEAEFVTKGDPFHGAVNNWQTVREGVRRQEAETLEDMDEDDAPVVVESDDVPRMSNGQRAGVLTKEEIKAEAERARLAEKRAMERLKREHQEEAAETVYRDVSGRKVDIKVKKAEEARRRREEIEKEAKRMEWGKGLVQRRAAEEEKRRLMEEKDKPLARYADDVELNQELKERERWNDPAAGFLTKKSTSKGKRLVRPTYKGAWKPNRFMIPPGYRWDGVDRSTGFEDNLLLQKNQAKSRAAEAHAWSTEDM